MENKNNDYLIFSLSASGELTSKVLKKLGVKGGRIELKKFLDGEIYIRLMDSVRGKHAFIIQSTSNPANNNLMELLVLVESLKRASVKEVTAVIPYFGYARQDRLNKGREAITSKLIAKLLETSGIDRIVMFEIHSSQIQGFFNIPTDNFKMLKHLVKDIRKYINLENTLILSPDFGSVKRANNLAEQLNLPLAIVDKRRVGHNEVVVNNVIGDYKGKNIIIIDDMIDTGNTLKKTIEIIKDDVKSINIVATHGVFSLDKTIYKNYDEYFDSFKKLGVEKIFVTNTICQKERKNDILKVIDISEQIAGIIKVIEENGSITTYYNK